MPSPHRPSTTARGYGAAHQRQRREWTPEVTAGHVNCRRCGQPIQPGQPWDLGHQPDRTQPTHPEHTGRDCPQGGNRATNRGQWRRPPEPHPGLRAATT